MTPDDVLGREYDARCGAEGVRVVRVWSVNDDPARTVRLKGSGTRTDVPWRMFVKLVQGGVLVPR